MYKDKFEKYCGKINILQNGGEQVNEKIDYESAQKIYSKVLDKTAKLEKIYDSFWKNIYYNDAYIFYKNAIEYYKNVQNNKIHAGFSMTINKKLFEGSCQYLKKDFRSEFNNSSTDIIPKIDLDDLCQLSIQVINILDTVFDICPKIPFDLVMYRIEKRSLNDDIFKFKKGDYYRNLGYMSTTLNPWLYYSAKNVYSAKEIIKEKKKYIVNYAILLPKSSSGYYMNMPFEVYDDKDSKKMTGFQEFEILLPRDNIYEIINVEKKDYTYFITMKLYAEINRKNNQVKDEEAEIPKIILKKSDIQKLIKDNIYNIIKEKQSNFDNFEINMRQTIYHDYKKLCKDKYNSNMIYTMKNYQNLKKIKNKEIKKWSKKEPKFKDDNMKQLYDSYNSVYNLFKKYNKKYIYIVANPILKYIEDQNNIVYDEIINNIKIKEIKITNPITFHYALYGSIYGDNATNVSICKTEYENPKIKENSYYLVDKNYPLFIIIKLQIDKISYLPIGFYRGMTYDIEKIKINNIAKNDLENGYYMYFIEGSTKG